MRRMLGVTALVALLVLVAGGAAAASPPRSAASTASRPPAWVQREARWQSLAAGEPQRWLVIDAALPKEKIKLIIWQKVSSLIEK